MSVGVPTSSVFCEFWDPTTIYPRFSTVCSLSCPTLIISFLLQLLTAAFCHLWCCLDGLLILSSPGPYVVLLWMFLQSPCLQIPLGRFSLSSLAALLPCNLLRYTRTSSSQMYCHKGLWVWQSRSFVFRSEPQVSPQVGDGNFYRNCKRVDDHQHLTVPLFHPVIFCFLWFTAPSWTNTINWFVLLVCLAIASLHWCLKSATEHKKDRFEPTQSLGFWA